MSPLLEFQAGARANFENTEVRSQPEELMASAFNSMCHGMAQSYYGELTERPIVVDKSRGWLHYWDWVEMWNPEPKMVCMVRDLRDVLCSMEKAYRANRHRPVGPDNPQNLTGITFEQRCEHWLSSHPVGLAMTRLKDAVSRELPILYLKFEDLTAKPQETLNQWYEFVGMEPFAHSFDEISKEVSEDCTVHGPYGSHKVKPKVEPPSHTWKDMMTNELSKDLKNVYSWFFDRFQYA